MKHLAINKISLALLGLLGLLGLEGLLRLAFAAMGERVGRLSPSWMYFVPVDSLVIKQEYYMDEHGIYRGRSDYWVNHNFSLNAEGFRGAEFMPSGDSSSKSVLFIGDSFTWGAHCDSNFCDILNRSPAYTCYNTGIPGNDPAQYERLVRYYLPRLQPDYTVLMFFLGNDLMDMSREIMPGIDLYFQTNAGWLPSWYKGRHFNTAQESYDYIADQYTATPTWKKVMLKTAIGTAIFIVPLRIKEYREWKKRAGNNVANEYITRIRELCEPESKFLMFLIPAMQQDLTSDFYKNPIHYIKENYPRLLIGLEDVTYVLPLQDSEYWPLPDGHFNYSGHARVAAFIDSTLQVRSSESTR